ncbi:MAG: tol-pal system-associated acyl-CoA thioesterase [Alphaproteobacteria bacterium]|nr:tol-pal system-associated acyl-CoA thioesterase [Alphaproteobacteria bacterium]|tara:strand:- start:1520 stop:1987 length:468 start_codon:yes stop_codon:yes gene_type:complete
MVPTESGSARDGTSGWFEGATHVLPVRVYYEDTDAAGIVYHANYLRFAERARTEMMRCLGTEHRQLMNETGVAFAVRSCDTEFKLPGRLDDPLTVQTQVHEVRGASLRITQTVLGEGGAELVRMQIRLACIDSVLRPARLPAPVHTELAKLVENQ